MPKAKHILHATKVDRIAIVDRPAVPDAQILVYKRKKGVIEKFNRAEYLEKHMGFDHAFRLNSIEGACSALENGFWNVMFNDQMEASQKTTEIKSLFSAFTETVPKILAMTTTVNKQAQEELTPEEVAANLKEGLSLTAISDGFQLFKNHVWWVVNNAADATNTDAVVKALTQTLQDFVLKSLEDFLAKRLKIERPQQDFEKAGRKISAARLAKLKQAMTVLEEIIGEVELAQADADANKEDKMAGEKTQEKSLSVEELTTALKSLQDTVAQIVEANKKYDERMAALEETLKAQKEVAEKSTTEKADLVKSIEGVKTEITKALEESKKAQGAAEERLVKVEKAVETVLKAFENLGKRMGVKTSLDIEKVNDKPEEVEDKFGDAVRGIKREKK